MLPAGYRCIAQGKAPKIAERDGLGVMLGSISLHFLRGFGFRDTQ
ncbi:hypothetical protein NSP_14300 [Nodularia spumigena CCY9414]|nr:hypothetical protein NSP_14300 [Nodularia spumigena CCY9414]